MAVKPGPDPVPCPCDACDEFAGTPDTYCTKCIHHGCSGYECLCPDAQRSPRFCDFCHQEKETVAAHPAWEEDHVCGDCHPDGELPDEEEWWDEEDLDEDEDDDDCPRCGARGGLRVTASCRSCGYIPPENVW